MDDREKEKNRIFKYAFFAACLVLLIFILWSAATETLIPLYREKVFDEFFYNLFGIPVIIAGTIIFAYGGWIFVRDTTRLFAQNTKIADNLAVIKDKSRSPEEIRAARLENTKFLISSWKKGSFWLLTGALIITAGGIIINLKKIL